MRVQCHSWVVTNRVSTIGAVYGKGLRVGTGGGGVEPLSSKGLRGLLHFQRHAVIVPI